MITFMGQEMFLWEDNLIQQDYEKSSYKILVFDWERWVYFNTDWYEPTDDDKIIVAELIAEIKKHDICFFFITEMIDMTCDAIMMSRSELIRNLLTEMNKLNVVYFMVSEDTHFPIDKSKSLNIPWFADKHIYTSKATTIDFDYRPKDFTFNMLLGSERPYRTKIFETLVYESYIYSTYFGHKEYKHKSAGHLEDGDIWNNLTNQDLSNKLNTMEHSMRENESYCISHITPELIYNNSHFDIVCESQPFRETLHFTTEKTGKPLSTGRFFIWYNSPHKVGYLKQFGFELQDYLCGYDNIIDDNDRLDAVIELIKEISDNENYIKKIYKDTKDARIHNQEVYKNLSNTTRENIDNWMTTEINRQHRR